MNHGIFVVFLQVLAQGSRVARRTNVLNPKPNNFDEMDHPQLLNNLNPTEDV